MMDCAELLELSSHLRMETPTPTGGSKHRRSSDENAGAGFNHQRHSFQTDSIVHPAPSRLRLLGTGATAGTEKLPSVSYSPSRGRSGILPICPPHFPPR